jgi:hypothetical protein
MTWTDRLLAGALTLAVATWAAPASAQTEATAARALFNEARALAEKGDHAAACPKFEESMRLRPGEGTRFNLADCWEQIGRTASAWGEFLEVASSSKLSGRKDREKLARRRAEALEPKLSRLIIQVAVRESELSVMRDGVEVRDGTWGAAVPVDPGRHSISARAPGKRPWFREIEVSGTEPVTVEIPRLEREKSAESADKPRTQRASDAEAESEDDAEENDAEENEITAEVEPSTVSNSGRETRRALAYVAGGATVAMVVLGTIFYLDFKSKNDQAASMCRAFPCDRRGVTRHNDLVDRAQASRTLSYLSFGAGTLALGAAAILYFTSEPSSPVESGGAVELRPLIGSGLTGLSASGSF